MLREYSWCTPFRCACFAMCVSPFPVSASYILHLASYILHPAVSGDTLARARARARQLTPTTSTPLTTPTPSLRQLVAAPTALLPRTTPTPTPTPTPSRQGATSRARCDKSKSSNSLCYLVQQVGQGVINRNHATSLCYLVQQVGQGVISRNQATRYTTWYLRYMPAWYTHCGSVRHDAIWCTWRWFLFFTIFATAAC